MRNETDEPCYQKVMIDTVGRKNVSPEIPIEEFYEMAPNSEQLVLFEVIDIDNQS